MYDINYFWAALGILVFYIVCVIFQYYRYYIMSKREKNKPPFKYVVKKAISGTVFRFLDQINHENSSVLQRNSQKLSQDQDKPNNDNQTNQIAINDYNGAVLCDCYDCFCEGCPWQIDQEKDVFKDVSGIYSYLANKIFAKLKYLGYFMLYALSYFYLPINFAVALSNVQGVIGAFGLVCQSLQFFVLCFTFSFISTKREMLRLNRDNDVQRGLLIFYHMKKAWIFTVITFFVLLTSTFIINDQNSTDWFLLYNSSYQFIYYLILAMVARYNQCCKNDLIQDDDRILKAQQQLYAIKNNLTKYFPTQIQQTYDGEDIDEVLTEMASEAKNHLQESIRAINNQKFKKIKKNLGIKKNTITFLVFYMYINLILMILISGTTYLYTSTSKVHDAIEEILNVDVVITTYFIINIIQFTLFPFLLGFMFDKKDLLGQDYGELTY
ncbi:hypothetical protein pb186bvf_015071 [Paramecium bursaria]